MAKLEHRFSDRSSMPQHLHNIPGLHVDYDGLLISGHIDAVEAAGVNVSQFKEYINDPSITLPTSIKVRKYQQEGAEWLWRCIKQHGGAILADDMGLGKTRTALHLAKNIPGNDFTLIVAPAAVATQWREEAATLGMPVDILGPKAKYKTAWRDIKCNCTGNFVVSPNLVADALDASPVAPSMIILDEPHMYLRGRQGKWIWDIGEYTPLIKYRLACTGTPMYNTPRDLWTLLFLLFKMRFGKAAAFDFRYCAAKINAYGGRDNTGASNIPELKQRLSHYMLRRTQADVAVELPPLTTAFRWVQANKEAQAAMLQSHGSAQGVDGALDKCLDAKLDETVSVALTLAEPCVIWTYHPHHAVKIASMLEEGHKSCIPIHGQISAQERAALIKQAQDTGASLACTIDSVGTGVNMQGVASTAIFHTIQRIPKKTHQAMKRLHRSGQQNTVHCIFIAMKDAMDEIVVDTVIKKLDYWNSLMGKDDLESNVGEALKVDSAAEEAVLRAIYEQMGDD